MAIERIFDKTLPPPIPGFLEQGISLVHEFLSICRLQKWMCFGPAKHKIREASKYSGFRSIMCSVGAILIDRFDLHTH